MNDEQELLKTRAKYPEADDWEKAKMLVFSPKDDEQLRMGVNHLLENNLIAQFIQQAGKDTEFVSRKVQQQKFQWTQYRKILAQVRRVCDEELFARFLWAIFTWAQVHHRAERTLYFKEVIDATSLVRLFHSKGMLKELLIHLIDEKKTLQSLSLLKQTFLNVEQDPKATAILVFNFIYAVRDLTDEVSVWSAFFKGFELTAGSGLTVTWQSSPMLEAITKTKGKAIAQLYEDFIRDLLTKAKSTNIHQWAVWQKTYDLEFLSWRNVMQSGMFKPDSAFEYTDS